MSVEAILEILDRAQTGPVCTVHDWDRKVIPNNVFEKLKEHGLERTCSPQNPISTDDDLVNKFFDAGFELAIDMGVLCLDTERIIKITDEELKDVFRNAPSELTLGEGLDKAVMRHRRVEDKYPPLLSAPLGICVSEDLYIPLVQAIAQHRIIDMLEGPSLETVYGKPIKSGTPYETLAGRVQANLHRDAVWRAGRPGISFLAVSTSPTVFGQLGGYGVPGGYKPRRDTAIVLSPAELKTSYTSLHKVVHAINCGGLICAGSWSMIGGCAGPPEGTVIASIASVMLQFAVCQASWANCQPMDLRYMGNCGRDAQWAISIIYQALSRNTHLLTGSVINQVSGPCTDMLLYESAVGMMNLSVSGVSMSLGPRSAGGKYTNYISPLECKFIGEVFKGSAGMKRSNANEIVKAIMPKYEDKLKCPPKGKSFTECFDMKNLKPTKEWLDIYNEVKKRLIDLGVPLEV